LDVCEYGIETKFRCISQLVIGSFSRPFHFPREFNDPQSIIIPFHFYEFV